MSKVDIQSIGGINHFVNGVVDGVAVPYDMVNALPNKDGIATKRKGYSPYISQVGCRNGWKSDGTGLVYCTIEGFLCVVDLVSRTITPIHPITNSEYKVYYTNVGLVDFIGNKYWLVAIENGIIREWGQSVDDLDSLDWQTTEDGTVLYMKDSAGEDTFVHHPGEFVHKPFPMDNFIQAFGRIWGCVGNFVVYSQSVAIEWFQNDKQAFDFGEETNMVAKVEGGIFVGTNKRVLFLSGTDPEKMTQEVKQYVGSVKNSVVYAPKFPDGPDGTPIWMDNDGVFNAGMPDGTVLDISKEVLNVEPHPEMTSGVINMDGAQMLLFKIKGE